MNWLRVSTSRQFFVKTIQRAMTGRARCTTISSFDPWASMDMHGIQMAGWPKGWLGEGFSFHPWWRRLFWNLGKGYMLSVLPFDGCCTTGVLSLGSEGAVFSLNGLHVS